MGSIQNASYQFLFQYYEHHAVMEKTDRNCVGVGLLIVPLGPPVLHFYFYYKTFETWRLMQRLCVDSDQYKLISLNSNAVQNLIDASDYKMIAFTTNGICGGGLSQRFSHFGASFPMQQ